MGRRRRFGRAVWAVRLFYRRRTAVCCFNFSILLVSCGGWCQRRPSARGRRLWWWWPTPRARFLLVRLLFRCAPGVSHGAIAVRRRDGRGKGSPFGLGRSEQRVVVFVVRFDASPTFLLLVGEEARANLRSSPTGSFGQHATRPVCYEAVLVRTQVGSVRSSSERRVDGKSKPRTSQVIRRPRKPPHPPSPPR